MTSKSFRELTGASNLTASPTDSVLLIIDAQNEYAEGHLKTKNVEKTRAAIDSLLSKYRNADVAAKNIVHIVHDTPAGTPIFTPGTDLAVPFQELTPRTSEKLIHKQYPGSFTGTDLQAHLQEVGAKKLVLTGYMAHVCVSTTARQAAELGYDIVIAGDAVGDRDIPGASGEEVTQIVLKELDDAFGTVVQEKDIQ